MNEVIISAKENEDGFNIYIGKIVAVTEKGNEVLFFDGEKWYPKTRRFEDMPVAFTISAKNSGLLQRDLSLENPYARKNALMG